MFKIRFFLLNRFYLFYLYIYVFTTYKQIKSNNLENNKLS